MRHLQFKIQIKDITKPPVWRCVLVPANISFDQLHSVIQIVFGWENDHLYAFSPKGYSSSPQIEIPQPKSPLGDISGKSLNAYNTKLYNVFTKEKQTYTYIYDFGDDWVHLITLEKIENKEVPTYQLLDGKGACPPEDCGGPWGYQRLKEVLADSKNPEYEDMCDWLYLESGSEFDPTVFDLENKQNRLSKLS